MAYNQQLAERVRLAIATQPAVTEKKMFGGLAFMINQKMAITVGANRIMVRVNPLLHEELVKKPGCSTVVMGGRNYKGYIHVQQDEITTDEALHEWVDLALEYNKIAPAAKK